MRKDSFRRAIEKILDEEADKFYPKLKEMPSGQRKVVKQNLLERMINELVNTFVTAQDGYLKLQIIRFLADYSGQKPAEVKELQFNPYDGMSVEELEKKERELLSYEEGTEVGRASEDKDSESEA